VVIASTRHRPGHSDTHHSHAFGLGLNLGFEVLGLTGAASPRPQMSLVRVAEDVIEDEWSTRDAERLVCARDAQGCPAMTVDRQDSDHRVWARERGLYLVAPARATLQCAPPPEVPAWQWQRLLIGQVLPLAAVLCGLEVLHASAVALDDRAVAFVGRTGSGKTSLALNLVLRGAGFVCDDVLALEPQPYDSTRAHPGPGLANLRHDEAARLREPHRTTPYAVIGEDEQGLRIALQRVEHALPLSRIYFIERGAANDALTLEATQDARLVLGATFNLLVRTRERMARQLDLSSRVAATAELFRMRIPPTIGAGEVANAIEAHARASA
jgi:hypothetical protein